MKIDFSFFPLRKLLIQDIKCSEKDLLYFHKNICKSVNISHEHKGDIIF